MARSLEKAKYFNDLIINLLNAVVKSWHRPCDTTFVLRGGNIRGFGSNKSQSAMSDDPFFKGIPLVGWLLSF